MFERQRTATGQMLVSHCTRMTAAVAARRKLKPAP
jgi:hypothetical protein